MLGLTSVEEDTHVYEDVDLMVQRFKSDSKAEKESREENHQHEAM